MDKETGTGKTNDLNKLTKKTYWIASIATLVGAAIIGFAISIEGSWRPHLITVGSLGIILGTTSLIIATTARIITTTALDNRLRISSTVAKVGFWLSIVTIILLVIAWAVVLFTILSYLTNPANF